MELSRNALVQAMGLSGSVATVSLGVCLGGRGVLSNELLFVSSSMVIPTLVGMALGTIIRSKIDESLFRKLFFVSLSAIGIWIVIRAISKLD